ALAVPSRTALILRNLQDPRPERPCESVHLADHRPLDPRSVSPIPGRKSITFRAQGWRSDRDDRRYVDRTRPEVRLPRDAADGPKPGQVARLSQPRLEW